MKINFIICCKETAPNREHSSTRAVRHSGIRRRNKPPRARDRRLREANSEHRGELERFARELRAGQERGRQVRERQEGSEEGHRRDQGRAGRDVAGERQTSRGRQVLYEAL